MSVSFRSCNIIAGLALAATASTGSAWAMGNASGAARPSPEMTARCARVKMKPPAVLAARPEAPAAGASDEQVRIYCSRLGFTVDPALASAEAGATEVAPLTVTGSYLKPSGSVDASTNIERTTRDDFLKTGSPTMTEFLRGLSEVGLSENGDNRGQNSQGYGITTINLRNLGAGRTLVLFDGVRLADDPQTNGGPAITRDPNVQGGGSQNAGTIPMEVLANVEILKDGGAAAYGGDAGGGAVNFTPRRDLNGVEVSFSHTDIPIIYFLPPVLEGLANRLTGAR
jgi:hypothetical protein